MHERHVREISAWDDATFHEISGWSERGVAHMHGILNSDLDWKNWKSSDEILNWTTMSFFKKKKKNEILVVLPNILDNSQFAFNF